MNTSAPYTILYILLLFFLAIIIARCLDKHFKNKKIWVKNPKLKLNYSFKNWRIADYAATAIVGCVASLFLLVLLQLMGGHIPYILPRIIFLMICVSTITFSISYYSLANLYRQYSGAFKIIATLTALVITLIANAMADNIISQYTHADPAKFPTTQKIFILIVAVALWIYLAMYAIFPVFILVLLKIFKNQLAEHFKQRTRSYADSCTNFKKSSARDFNLGLASIIGVIYTSLILLGLISNTDSKLVDKTLKKILVSASFHLRPEACKIDTFYSDSYVAFISEDKVLLAIPDLELGYTFQERKCDVQPIHNVRKPIQPIHRLNYGDYSFNAYKVIPVQSCPIQYCSVINGNFCI
ncbi:hypothetical protein NQ186_10060 [Pseudomonas zeae]|uniref:hypothetical protein n=1 Tax=Pseudomonas zeae TaxID=2745510 RepID=UPI00214770F0|nr:hypothetical protein [Pseudomonas zeae]UUT14508.1 hypothetical protein NQ186_10060 [Pseudomonas zeae]